MKTTYAIFIIPFILVGLIALLFQPLPWYVTFLSAFGGATVGIFGGIGGASCVRWRGLCSLGR